VALLVNSDRVGTSGFCSDPDHCFVPLQRSDTAEGWRVRDNGDTPTIELPAAVCENSPASISQVAVVEVTPSCPAIQVDQPLCSPPDGSVCLVRNVCPSDWPENDWIGYVCSGGNPASSRPNLLNCWSPPADADDTSSSDGRWCCLTGQEPSDDPLLLDDMTKGPQIKRKPQPDQNAGWWFADIPGGSGDLLPGLGTALYTYRHFDEPVGAPEGPQFDRAACLSSSGFRGWFALEGFNFATDKATGRPALLDVNGYAGINFWAWADEPFTDDPLSVVVTFPNSQASAEPDSPCVVDGSGTTRCESFYEELNLTSQWQHYFVRWDELHQSARDWNQIRYEDFERQIYAVTFGVKGAGPTIMSQPFDFCIADIRFEETEPSP